MPVGVAQTARRPSSPSVSLRPDSPTKSLIPRPLLVPRADKRPHLLTAPIDPVLVLVLVPAAAPGRLDDGGGGEGAEAGEGAGDAVAVAGGASFAQERVDAVVGVLCGEGAADPHGG